MSCIYRKLISLNLMLLILCSMIYIPAYAESDADGLNIKAQTGDTGVLIVDGIQYDADQNIKGDGWRYSVNKYVENGPDVIYLNNYTGSGIIFKKNIKSLQIYVSGNNKIVGKGMPCIEYDKGNLFINMGPDGKMDMYAGKNYPAVSSKEVSLYADSKSLLNIYGSDGIAAVKSDYISIESENKGAIKITGGVNGSAVEVNENIKLYSGHLELKGNNRPAINCNNDEVDYIITDYRLYKYFIGNDENNMYDMESYLPGYQGNTDGGSSGGSSGSGGSGTGGGSSSSGGSYVQKIKYIGKYNGEMYLKTQPKTYNLTMDANGGSIENNNAITLSVEFADGINLNNYEAERKGFLFDGWYEKKTDPYYVYNRVDLHYTKATEDLTVYAGWFEADNGDVMVRSFPNRRYGNSATVQGNAYFKLSDLEKIILPSCLYTVTSSNLVAKPYEVDLWIDQKYSWENNGYKILTDKNGEKYASYMNGIYTSGSEVSRDSNRIKIMKPFNSGGYNALTYYLGDGEVVEGGNVIYEESWTSGDLHLYARDDSGILCPDDKKLIGWSLTENSSYVDYKIGDIIPIENGEEKNVYAVWGDIDEDNKAVKFENVDSNEGTYYAAYYDSRGKMLKSLNVKASKNRTVNIILSENDYYETHQVKLFTLDPKTHSPVNIEQTAVKNSNGEFEVVT